MKNQKKKYVVLIFTVTYLPGFKAGGPIRSIANMVDHLSDEFCFKIIAMDRDLHDAAPYPNINRDNWNSVNGIDIFYMISDGNILWKLKKILTSNTYDIIYLNGFFSVHFTFIPLLLRLFGIIPNKPIVLSTRGEFASGPLNLKKLRKKIYLKMAKAVGLYKGVLFVASSDYEEADIRQYLGDGMPVVIAPNLPPVLKAKDILPAKAHKESGKLKLIFLSRIAIVKNLLVALKVLQGLKGDISFDIYGPMEDGVYWAECQNVIDSLEDNIHVRYCGSVPHSNVSEVLGAYDVFFLPTMGENFGHVILEAFCAGCPVLISDKTPWRDLEKKEIGWDIALDQTALIQLALKKCIAMDNEEYRQWSRNAWEYGTRITQDDAIVLKNKQLFYKAVSLFKQTNQEILNV